MGRETRHDLDECFDREGLRQHRGRSEVVGLLGGLLVPGTHDDRRRRIELPDATHGRMRAAAVVSVETHEIGDDQIGSCVRCGVLEPAHQQQLVALIAQHLAKEVSSGDVVLDDQYLGYSTNGRGFLPGPQF